MNTIDTKLSNCYTQGQRRVARILFTVWLLTSCSPDATLAAPEGAGVMVLATAASSLDQSSPGALTLPPASGPALERALQQRMSQRAVLDKGRDLLRTSIQVSPGGENLSFQAQGGEQVRFRYERGHWRAEVSSQLGAFARQSLLPVVCSLGEDVARSLEVLSRYPSWQRQRRIHVLGRNVCPTPEPGASVLACAPSLLGLGATFQGPPDLSCAHSGCCKGVGWKLPAVRPLVSSQ